jgi:hypothetical protein
VSLSTDGNEIQWRAERFLSTRRDFVDENRILCLQEGDRGVAAAGEERGTYSGCISWGNELVWLGRFRELTALCLSKGRDYTRLSGCGVTNAGPGWFLTEIVAQILGGPVEGLWELWVISLGFIECSVFVIYTYD